MAVVWEITGADMQGSPVVKEPGVCNAPVAGSSDEVRGADSVAQNRAGLVMALDDKKAKTQRDFKKTGSEKPAL